MRCQHQEPTEEVREGLKLLDSNCKQMHHVKVNHDMNDIDLQSTEFYKLGHSMLCTDAACERKLRILMAVSVHYPKIRNLLLTVYKVRQCHKVVKNVDDALDSGSALHC